LNLTARLRCDVTLFRHHDGRLLVTTKVRARCP
jgi:hypothetical protein